MKPILLTIFIFFFACTVFAGNTNYPVNKLNAPFDTVKLKADSGRNLYYQNVIMVPKSITVDVIYNRIVQFMATKNIQQTFGYQQDGKLIFTTSQDLNVNPSYPGDDGDNVLPYTVQFAIIIDLKPGSFRYTITNIVFYYPTQTGNKRETLLETYYKATYNSSKRIAKNGSAILNSYERFLEIFTTELRQGVEQKSPMYSKF